MRRQAFTVVELIAVLGVIALLLAILVPAVLYARESARRSTCQDHLRQIGVAMHNHEALRGEFPSGGTTLEEHLAGGSFHYSLLPWIERGEVIAAVKASPDGQTATDFLNALEVPSLFRCPSDPQNKVAGSVSTNYATCVGTSFTPKVNGFFVIGKVRAADVVDGLSNTAAVSEILIGADASRPNRGMWFTADFYRDEAEMELFAKACVDSDNFTNSGQSAGWHSNAPRINFLLRPNQSSCFNGDKGRGNGDVEYGAYTAGSEHLGGVQVLFGDGSVKLMADSITLAIWRALGTRDGRETGTQAAF